MSDFVEVLECFEEAACLGRREWHPQTLIQFSTLPKIDEEHLDEWMRSEEAYARKMLTRAIAERRRDELEEFEARSNSRPEPLSVEEQRRRRRLVESRADARIRSEIRARRAALRSDPRYAVWDQSLRDAVATGAFG